MSSTSKRIRSRWTRLPISLLSLVLGSLSPNEVLTCCRLVCVQWRDSHAAWHSLVFTSLHEAEAVMRVSERSLVRSITVTDAENSLVRLVCGVAQLQRLELRDVTSEGFTHVGELDALQVLTLKNLPKPQFDLQPFARLHNLTELNLVEDSLYDVVTDEGMRHLSSLTSLRSLTLRYLHIPREGLHHLSKLSRLHSLNLLSCSGVTNEGLRELCAKGGLQRLSLDDSDGFTREGLRWLITLQGLRELYLNKCVVEDDDLRELCTLSGLQSLDLEMTGVTNEGLRHVGALLALKTLWLQMCSVGDDGLRHICALPALETLNLTYCEDVTDEGLRHLSLLPALQILILDYCYRVTDAGLRHVRAIPALHTLSVWDGEYNLAVLEH